MEKAAGLTGCLLTRRWDFSDPDGTKCEVPAQQINSKPTASYRLLFDEYVLYSIFLREPAGNRSRHHHNRNRKRGKQSDKPWG